MHAMSPDPNWFLPDPHSQPEFYADVPLKRLLAWIIDSLLILVITLLIVPFTAFTALLFLPLLGMAVSFAYRVITIANGSATPGMRLLAIELRNRDGSRLDTSTAFAHTLGYSLSFVAMPLQVLSMILMASTERGQGLTDMVLGTVALNRRAGA